MHDTRKRTGTNHCKTNNSYSNSTLTAYQTITDKNEQLTDLPQIANSEKKTMADNNNNRQNTDKFNRDSQLKYH